MLLDLIRAVTTAVLVGVLPGWFWAECLCATTDRAERLAYSIALSITLVPSAALIQARLFGTGVTFAIALVSIALVAGTGLVAYLRFGPAKGSEGPLILRRPAPLDLPTLMPLIGAFALVAVTLTATLPGWQVVPAVALLIFLAGAARLLGSGNAPPSQPQLESPEVRSPRISSWICWLLLSETLVLVLLRSYPGPWTYDWPFPRGVDKWEHAVMVNMTLSMGSTKSFFLYPPGFHFLAAEVSRLSGLEPLKLFAVLAPALLLLPSLACYALGRRLWGWEAGVAAAFFSGLILSGPYLHLREARWPNLIGGDFLLVLAVAALMQLYRSKSFRDGLLLAVLGSSVVFYHQVASFTMVALLALVVFLFLPYLLLYERRIGVALLCSLALLSLLSVLYAWDTYDLPRLVSGLLGEGRVGRGGEAVAMAVGTKPFPLGMTPLFSFDHLVDTTSQVGLWLGLLGALLLLVSRGSQASTPETLAQITLLVWGLLLFVGSRTAMSVFPDRFEQDLSMPLALLAAIASVTILRTLLAGKPVTVLVAYLVVVLTVAVVGIQALENLEESAGPAEIVMDRPPPPEVVQAGKWLKQHNTGGDILVKPWLGYVPSRGMLAMGGYTGMQSFSAARIRWARDLPPSGAGPLWDSLWVLHHPEGERTRRILRQNDVRYIVFEKEAPIMNGRAFVSRQDLYRVVFENKDVIIVAPQVRSPQRNIMVNQEE